MRDFYLESQFDMAFYNEEIEAVQESYRKKKLREALFGPIISLIIHLGILISIFYFGTDNPINEVKEITVNIYSQNEILIEPLPIETVHVIDENELRILAPDFSQKIEDQYKDLDSSFLDSISSEDPTTNDLVLNDHSLSDIILSRSVITDNISGGLEENTSSGEGSFSSMSLPVHRTKEKQIVRTVQNGGTKEGQDILNKSLWWLASVQNPDGSWGKQDKRAMTGLAVLTFLAHGETHLSKHFGRNMKKAFLWLINDEVDRSHDKGYGHAIKTYAICESYSMTALNVLEEPMNKSVEALISGQQKNGAFDYKLNPDSMRQDTSVSGWAMQALKAAWVAGAENRHLRDAIEKGLGWLKERSGDKGSFPYSVENGQHKGGNKYSMRAIGALCLQLYGESRYKELQDELKIISTVDVEKIDWDKPPVRSLYAWYYSTQSVFQLGGVTFRRWNAKMEPMLIENQHPKGYWVYPGKNHASASMDDLTSKIYSTTLCSLILTVYYRYLPTYKGLFQKRPVKVEVKEEMVNVVE
ncbi:MAG: terpene cyclase/mutase family protein [Lentisphaeraceae bacterium]|nr:terpene cyclase/mutase family protein [Lentisphaeraceae bacterium]